MIFRPVRTVLHWAKYEKLHHYPALRAFPPDQALKRLRAYEWEERKACRPWLTIAQVGICISILIWAAWSYYNYTPLVNATMILTMVPGWVLQYVLHRRIKRRVEVKVAAELADGRLWTCVECGYDLRASPGPLCPECGSDIRVPPSDK